MKLFIAAPPNLLKTSHVERALEQAQVDPSELLLLTQKVPGATETWLREWARNRKLPVREYQELAQVLGLLARSKDAALIAIVSPDHPETLDQVAQAESRRIPIYVYRELYRLDPRVNCRFSPVERPDVWLRALTAEQRDFFRRLHSLCQQYGVELNSHGTGDGSLLSFPDGTEFEGVELEPESLRVRPRGSFRYRRIPLD